MVKARCSQLTPSLTNEANDCNADMLSERLCVANCFRLLSSFSSIPSRIRWLPPNLLESDRSPTFEIEMNPRRPSLIGAVIDGDTETVRALLAAGSDVNETVSGGRTPLIMAILFERTQIMTLLLEAGADPHQRDSLGLNAEDWAERKGLNLLNQREVRKQEI